MEKRDLISIYTTEELNSSLLIVNTLTTPKFLSESHYNEVIGLDNVTIKKNYEEKVEIALGQDDFAALIKSNREFVDKSLFIEEFLESKDLVELITRPRRWGKTTIMQMLKSFLSINMVNVSNKSVFEALLISQSTKIMFEYHRKYPVIFISLKNIKAENYQKLQDSLKEKIILLYRQYSYLLQSPNLENFYKHFLEQYLFGNITEVNIERSLLFLSTLLEKHFQQKVFILIDEYDSPLNEAHQGTEYNKGLKLLRAFLGCALKGNDSLKKAVVTGITKSDLFSDVNNLVEYSILDSKYAQYYGFTEDEVETLINNASMKDEELKVAVKTWYSGYQIGNFILYNPWSITSFFNNMKIRPYWVNTESMLLGDRRFSSDLLVTDVMQEQVRKLIANFNQGMKKTIEIILNPQAVLINVKYDPVATWTLLAYSGYLSVSYGYINADCYTITVNARIPNLELLGIYMSSMSLWIKDKLGDIDLNGLHELLRDFELDNITQFKETVSQIISNYGPRMAQENESIFHSLIEVICMVGGDKHTLSSENKSRGRIGSIFYPLFDKSDTVIIHKYKILKVDMNQQHVINEAREKAFWQVYEKNYLEEIIATNNNNFHDSHYKKIEIRSIVILVDENSLNFTLSVDSNIHSVQDSIQILTFFQQVTTEQLTHLKINSIVEILSLVRQGLDPCTTISQL